MPKNKKRRRSTLDASQEAIDLNGSQSARATSIPRFTGVLEPSDPRPYAITKLAHLPRPLHKFWFKRHHLFSLFDQHPGVLLDEQSWYSVTPECIAAWTAERCAQALDREAKGKGKEVQGARPSRVLDAFCGAGGNAIQFAMVFDEVVAMDIDPLKIALARHNARIYGVEDRITFVVGDYFEMAKEHAQWKAKGKGVGSVDDAAGAEGEDTGDELRRRAARQEYDLCSPPWGGVSYLEPSTLAPVSSSDAVVSDPLPTPSEGRYATYPLSSLCAPQGGRRIISSALGISQNLALFLPRNVDLDELVSFMEQEADRFDPGEPKVNGLGKEGDGQAPRAAEVAGERNCGPKRCAIAMDLEENWAGGRLRALTLYTGDLARGRKGS